MRNNMTNNTDNHTPNAAGFSESASNGTNPRKTPEQISADLANFIGSQEYHRFWFGIALLTEGVFYLAEAAQCHWLLDAIASYQPEIDKQPDQRLHEIQFWKLRLNADKSALLTCVADSGEPPAFSQKIEWTDFPLPQIDIWVSGQKGSRVALLPSEY